MKDEQNDNIYRHEEEEDFELVPAAPIDEEAKNKVEEHIETYIGPIENVYHEILSHLIHVDVYHVAPSEERPFHTFVTHGMSDLAMNVPEGLEDLQYAELVCILPEEWKVTQESFEDEKYYWPIENLKYLTRFPFEFDTWLGMGHTIQNDNPAQPFSSDTDLCATLLIPSASIDEEFDELVVRKDKTIYFYNAFPLYLEEMHFKMQNSVDELIDRFEEHRISDIYDVKRVNVCK